MEKLRTSSVDLEFPIKAGDRTIASVVVRRPTVTDLRAIDKARGKAGDSEMEQGIVMAAVLCGIPMDVMGDMDAADFAKISEVISGFLPRPQA
jgi:hypothetical protein